MGKEELDWMNLNPEEVSKYSGKWIALDGKKGIIAAGDNLEKVALEFKKKFPGKVPCVFKVPREDEEIIAL